MTTMTEQPPVNYLRENCTMPFCKGCGHSHVLRKLDEALRETGLQPDRICLVTDIGCIGLADALFPTLHTVHTTHGRSTAFATGIELADSVLNNSGLKTVVLIGDGGAMIGLLHLVNAALMNADVTVILCNNFLFGMTGGQHSAFSPLEFITPTTPMGNIVPPLDLCRVMVDANGEFVARKLATDPDLSGTIARAIQHPGFALVEVVELCTEHAVEKNELSGRSLSEAMERQGHSMGILSEKALRPSFGTAYRDKFGKGCTVSMPRLLQQEYTARLKDRTGIILAGSAGERVQSAARALAESAILCGLHCTQKNDNPVTQGSGFSMSEVVLSPHEINYTAIENPSAIIVVSEDGMHELIQQKRFEHLTSFSLVLMDDSLPKPKTKADCIAAPFRKEFGPKKAAVKALEMYLRRSGIIPVEALAQTLLR